MSTLELKNKIIKRIIEIDDINMLKSMEILLNTSDENISKFLNLAFEKNENHHETEDFSSYIKEWVKNM